MSISPYPRQVPKMPTYSLAPKPRRRCPAPGRSAHPGGGVRKALRSKIVARWLNERKGRPGLSRRVIVQEQEAGVWLACAEAWAALSRQCSPPPLRLPSRHHQTLPCDKCHSFSYPNSLGFNSTASYHLEYATITQASPASIVVVAACAITTVLWSTQSRLQRAIVYCSERPCSITTKNT